MSLPLPLAAPRTRPRRTATALLAASALVFGGLALAATPASAVALATASTTVLIIPDRLGAGTTALADALTAAGDTVTVAPVLEYQYNGTNPSPVAFDAVIHLDGNTYSQAMPTGGQTALANYVAAGGGYVAGEWNSLETTVTAGTPGLRDLVLIDRFSGTEGSNATYTATAAGLASPVLTGLTPSFVVSGSGWGLGTLHTFGVQPAVTLATVTGGAGGVGVAARDFGLGRAVNIADAGNYLSGLLDTDVQRFYVNAVGYVARHPSTLTTQASAPVEVGGSVSDSATVTVGLGEPTPTGTVTFTLYGPNDATCAGIAVDASTNTLDAAGSAQSDTMSPPSGGTYRFVVVYSGDGYYAVRTSPCNSANESVDVTKLTPTITTRATPAVVVGQQISDTATVSLGYQPTGTVTFTAYGPDDVDCTGTVAYTSPPVTVAGDGEYSSAAYTVTAAGTYLWRAAYSGDPNNNSVTTPCGDANEFSDVGLTTPTLTTQATVSAEVGTDISDTADLADGNSPTGTITFNLFGPDDQMCARPAIYTDPVTVNGNGSYTSGSFTTTQAAGYRWTATYSGDTANASVTPGCNDSNEFTDVAPLVSVLTTRATSQATVGDTISDTATVSMGYHPTGTITFNLFAPGDTSCNNLLSRSTATVNGNGDYMSDPYTATTAGAYRWVAVYPGDINNYGDQGSCGDATETTTVSPASSPGGGGGGTPGSPDPSPSASPTPSPSASPTPSPSASASSPSPTASAEARAPLTLMVRDSSISAGTTATLDATGTPGELYQLRCYTRPSTTYFTAREGAFSADGHPATFTLSLGRNTRCFIQYATNSAQDASPSVVVNVRTVLSLGAIRTAVRTYTFQGRNLPRAEGQLITLYRIDAAGHEIRTSNLHTDASGIYRLSRLFTGTGTFQFRVRTPQTLNNAAGASEAITVSVH